VARDIPYPAIRSNGIVVADVVVFIRSDGSILESASMVLVAVSVVSVVDAVVGMDAMLSLGRESTKCLNKKGI